MYLVCENIQMKGYEHCEKREVLALEYLIA